MPVLRNNLPAGGWGALEGSPAPDLRNRSEEIHPGRLISAGSGTGDGFWSLPAAVAVIC